MERKEFEFLYVTASIELSRAEILIIKEMLKACEVKEICIDLWNKLEKTDKELKNFFQEIDQTIG